MGPGGGGRGSPLALRKPRVLEQVEGRSPADASFEVAPPAPPVG